MVMPMRHGLSGIAHIVLHRGRLLLAQYRQSHHPSQKYVFSHCSPLPCFLTIKPELRAKVIACSTLFKDGHCPALEFILDTVASHIDWLREFCLGLPHATEDVQWGEHLLFRIAGKIFCITSLEPSAPVKVCFKCTPEKFAELVEIEGIIPAPYMARNHWVAMVEIHALRQAEIKELVRNSYQLVFGRLPKRLQGELSGPAAKHRIVKSGSRPKAKAKSSR